MTSNASQNPSQPEIDALFSLYHSGVLPETENLCRKLLDTYPGSAFLLNMLGVVLNSQGNSAEARSCYESAISVNLEYADPQNNLGIILKNNGRLHEAMERFEKAIQLDSSYSDARNNLGVVLQELGEHDKALLHLSEAVRLSPNSALTHFNQGKSLRVIGKLEAALLAYDKAIDLNKEFIAAYNNRGNLLEDLHRNEDARDSYSQAIQLDPGYSPAYTNRGLVSKKIGDYDGAVKDFTRALELDSQNPEGSDQDLRFRLHVNMGDILVYLRKYEQAIYAYDQALTTKPDNRDVLGFKGNAIAALGRIKEGLALKQEAFGIISFDAIKGVSVHLGNHNETH